MSGGARRFGETARSHASGDDPLGEQADVQAQADDAGGVAQMSSVEARLSSIEDRLGHVTMIAEKSYHLAQLAEKSYHLADEALGEIAELKAKLGEVEALARDIEKAAGTIWDHVAVSRHIARIEDLLGQLAGDSNPNPGPQPLGDAQGTTSRGAAPT